MIHVSWLDRLEHIIPRSRIGRSGSSGNEAAAARAASLYGGLGVVATVLF